MLYVFLVVAQDLCDVSSTGRWCQGTSCCVAEADICRSKQPWPEVTFHRGTERAGDGCSLFMWPGEPYTTFCSIYSLLILLTSIVHILQHILSLALWGNWLKPLVSFRFLDVFQVQYASPSWVIQMTFSYQTIVLECVKTVCLSVLLNSDIFSCSHISSHLTPLRPVSKQATKHSFNWTFHDLRKTKC